MPAKIAAPNLLASDGHIIAAQLAMGEARKQAQLPKRIRSEESPFFAKRGLAAADTTHKAAVTQARITSALAGEASAENGIGDGGFDGIWTPGFHKAMQEMKMAPLRAASCQCLKGEIANPVAKDKLDVDEIRAAVEDAVEEAVEHQVAEALGPLRLIVKDLTDVGNVLGNVIEQASNESSREWEDLHEQNDVVSRQIDLQYRDIAQHSEMSRAQLRAQAKLVESQGSLVESHSGLLHTQNNMINFQTKLADAHSKIADATVQNQKSVKENLEKTCNLIDAQSKVADANVQTQKSAKENLETICNLVDAQTKIANANAHVEKLVKENLKTTCNLVDTTTQIEKLTQEKLETACNLVGALTQIIANLPTSIDKAIKESFNKAVIQAIMKGKDSVTSEIAAGHQKSQVAFQASAAFQHNPMDHYTVEEFMGYEGKDMSLDVGSAELSENAGSRKENRKRFGSVGAMWRRMTR
ncbi:hypothetical protein CDD80_5050 [Ophiocordyceps camponoti-rufipedis]|uniref:Uncharacterized protein n=1 Tax=Ophiocordyceps camponoti-rufipedis TaxID=2004952 RepID=A0A2C5YWI7_9HYPO|nr:hypothetical protein CDD80_5050 [Ophiocordyceps camponoti-rufipedis]